MSSDSFSKENFDIYFKELAKEFRKINGKSMPAEIILVGGAAILVNYGFREMTTDIDAVIHASSSMKDAINRVRDKFDLPNGWLNADFMKTGSYSSKLSEYSVYYKTFLGIISVRIITAEYLIAMKLRSGRKYKNDLSDIIGILAEHKKMKKNISLDMINTAVYNLYGGWDDFPEGSRIFIENTIKNGEYEKVYQSIKYEENQSRDILIQFEKEYPNVTKESNVDDILKVLKNRLNDK